MQDIHTALDLARSCPGNDLGIALSIFKVALAGQGKYAAVKEDLSLFLPRVNNPQASAGTGGAHKVRN